MERRTTMKTLLLILSLFALIHASARSFHVYPGKGSPLRLAIESARNGDSVILHAGTYKEGEPLHIKTAIYLLGEGKPIIDGEKKYEILIIESDYVTIEGITFRNSGTSGYEDIAALRILNKGHIYIANNRFENTFFGVYSQHAYYTTIANNYFKSAGINEQGSANGIHCWKSDHMVIVNNYITGHRDGIYFEFVTNSTIAKNKSESNLRYGLHFMFSSQNRYLSNTFSNNGAGVAVMYSKGIHMKGNNFINNWGDAAYGILLKEITDSQVEQNEFTGNTTAIYLEGSSRINILNNQFFSNGWAVKMQASSTENEIRANNFQGNSFDVATNGSLQLNNFSGNYWDKYEGYDLDRNGIGDVPFRPVSMFSVIVERNPPVLMMFHSFMTTMMDKAERMLPGITPVDLIDNKPLMKPFKSSTK